MRGWFGAVGVLVLVACGSQPHATLHPPPPNLTPEQRIYAFHQLRSVGETTTIVKRCGQHGCSENVEGKTLYLANGTRVHHAEDLLPVLAPTSESAEAVVAAQGARRKAKVWFAIAVGAALAALIVWSQTDNELLVIGIGAPGLLGAGGMAWKYGTDALAYTERAHATYDAGLAQRLAVCVSGIYVVPCEASGSVPPRASTRP